MSWKSPESGAEEDKSLTALELWVRLSSKLPRKLGYTRLTPITLMVLTSA